MLIADGVRWITRAAPTKLPVSATACTLRRREFSRPRRIVELGNECVRLRMDNRPHSPNLLMPQLNPFRLSRQSGSMKVISEGETFIWGLHLVERAWVMSAALEFACQAAGEWIRGLDTRPVGATATLPDLRRSFGGPLPRDGRSAEEVIRTLARDAAGGMHGNAGGRFFAWVFGGGLESALAAGWLVATWDQNAALYSASPAAAVIEEVAGEWIKELLDLPRDASRSVHQRLPDGACDGPCRSKGRVA